MCQSSNCLGYILLFSILFFTVFIFVLLKVRKRFLQQDLSRTPESLKRLLPKSQPFAQDDFIFSTWQDGSNTMSLLIFRNHLNEEIARAKFPLAAREYPLSVADQDFMITVNLTWGGSSFSLLASDGRELAHIKRKSLNPMKHEVFISDFGSLKSSQPLWSLRVPITYFFGKKQVGATQLISLVRKVGRVGYFSKEVPLPVQIFILAMTS